MMVGEGIGKPVDGRSVVSRSGQTQGLRPSRISANWVPEQKMVELITNGNRFAWRVCNECAKFDRLNKACGVLGEPTTGGSGCDLWFEIAY